MPALFDREKAMERRRIVGARVRCARLFVEPNRAKFARGVGVDVSTIRKIEDGVRSGSRELLEHIAHLLRVSMDYLEWGSLSGVDPELAGYLAEHCQAELSGRTGRNTKASASHSPRRHAGDAPHLGQ